MKVFEGVYPALLTPFNRGGETVDLASIPAVVDHLIQEGAHGLFITGSTGEGPSLQPDEHKSIIDAVMKPALGKIPVIVQCSYNQPWKAIDVARHAEAAKADAIALLAPHYFGIDEKSMINHFRSIADAVPGFPVFLYNIPSRTGNNITASIVEKLLKTCPNLTGIKESGNFENLKQWMAFQSESFFVFNGMDNVELDAYKMGVRALVSSFANILTSTFAKLHQSALAGDWAEVQKQQDWINKMITVVDNVNIIANMKAIQRYKGVPAGYPRPPLRELEESEKTFLFSELKKIGYFA